MFVSIRSCVRVCVALVCEGVYVYSLAVILDFVIGVYSCVHEGDPYFICVTFHGV